MDVGGADIEKRYTIFIFFRFAERGCEALLERDLDARVGRHKVDGEEQAGGFVTPRRGLVHEPGFLEKKEEKQGLTLGRGLYTQIYNCRVRSTCVCSQTTRDSQEARRPQRNMATGSTTGSRLAVAVVRKAGASHMEMKGITRGR